MLIFSTERNLDILSRATDWAMDVTFDAAPMLFTQVYSIHATFMERTLPLVYALLPNKNQATYQTLFAEIKNLTRQNARPERVITDFELAAMNGFSQEYPNVQQRGCFFHFSQNVYRRIQRAGLQAEYVDDADFVLKCRMILGLAFVPPADVAQSFEELSDYLPDRLQPVLDYVEDNYIGRINRRGVRRTATFEIGVWNMYDFVVTDYARVKNLCASMWLIC